MTQVLHLVRHDLLTHRRLLVAWLVVVLAQPLLTLLAGPAISATGIAVPVFLITSRLLLAAVALGTIVQADSPLDDRTFWRTRPIAARTMATAKLLIGAVVVAVPLLVVLIVAPLVRVPWSHWPSTIAQVVVTDAAAVGLVLLLASRTRTVASMLIAVLGTVVGSYGLLIAITETLQAPWLKQFYTVAPPNSQLAVPTMLMIIVLAAWTMTALVFLGQHYRLRLSLVGAVSVLALAVVWFVPAARLHRASPQFYPRPSLSVDATQVRAERLESGRIVLLTTGTLSGVESGDRSRQYLVQGTIESEDGQVGTRRLGDPRFVTGRLGPHPVLLGGLSEADFKRFAGRSVRFQGRVDVEVARTERIGTLPLVANASVAVGHALVRIREVRPSVPLRLTFAPLATVDVTWTATWKEPARWGATQWYLRHGAEREYVFRFMQTPFVGFGLLPSLAWPFGLDRSVLYVPQRASPMVAATSALEVEEHRGVMHTELPLSLRFFVPTTVTPYDATRDSR